MAPYRDIVNGGFRHLDPLEVTRTTSNNSMSSISDSPTNSRLSASAALFECDYDTNPTVLYQAIEAKQWDYAISLFTKQSPQTRHDDENDHPNEEEASATWVVRKEFNGKLRWRLLPLHAAVIFGAPIQLVELLLADYPLAAQCKDDRGMLPLHLAFRNQASWNVIEELLTTYPMGVFVSDRKGRTPLQCGLLPLPHPSKRSNPNSSYSGSVQSASSRNTTQSASTANKSQTSFDTFANILAVYSQIVTSGERKKVEQETRTLAQNSLSQLQDSHRKQLEYVRKKAESQERESNHRIRLLEEENQRVKERLALLEDQLVQKDESHSALTKRLRLMNVQLDLANERAEEIDNPSESAGKDDPQTALESTTLSESHRTNTPADKSIRTPRNKSIDKMLRMMAETMVRQQKAYHGKVQELFQSYEELVTEREAIRSILLKEPKVSTKTCEDDGDADPKHTGHNCETPQETLESFRKWFQEEGKKLAMQERSLSLSPSLSSLSLKNVDHSHATKEGHYEKAVTISNETEGKTNSNAHGSSTTIPNHPIETTPG